MTASMVHVTNLTLPREWSANIALVKTPVDDSQYGPMTASMVHVTNLPPPGETTLPWGGR
jgi:hypothetical protein